MKILFVDLDGTTFTLKNFFRTKNFYSTDTDLHNLLLTIPAQIVYVTSRSKEEVCETKNVDIMSSLILYNDKIKNIKEYVEHNNISEYVVIDDDKNLKYAFPNHTVIIDWFNGYTVRDFFETLRLLKLNIKFVTDKGTHFIDVNNVDVSFEKVKALLKLKFHTPNLNVLDAIIYESQYKP
jgi:hypothetical protein